MQSFVDSNQIQNLRQQRKHIEEQTRQRIEDHSREQHLKTERIQREQEHLISDRAIIDRRNNHLLRDLANLKQATLKNLAEVKQTDENLVLKKQQVFEHLQKHNPRLARDFHQMTNLSRHRERLDGIEAKAAQIKEKENEINQLNLNNQALKEELQFQTQQQGFINQYLQRPFQPNSPQFNNPQNNNDNSQSMEMRAQEQERRVLEQYGNNSQDYSYMDESQRRLTEHLQQMEQQQYQNSYAEDFEQIDEDDFIN